MEQAADTLEELARDVLSAGTTIRYANGVASRGVVADTISLTDVQISVRTLQVNKAKKITRIVNPDTGYATSPINAAFVGLVGPNVLLDLKNLTGWVPIEKYANKADVMEGETSPSLKFPKFGETIKKFFQIVIPSEAPILCN